MSEFGKKSEIDKKAYEITYALFRIMAEMPESSIGKKLADLATELLAAAIARKYRNAEESLGIIDFFIKLAFDTDALNFIHGDLLIKEIGTMKVMLAHAANAQGKAVDIQDFFSQASGESTESSVSPSAKETIPSFVSASNLRNDFAGREALEIREERRFAAPESFQKPSEQKISNVNRPNPQNNFLKSGMRQIAILDKVRQSGNCRLKDIQEILPDTSERTIRYDLEDLIERNLIERMGTGGPSVYYKIRQSA